MSDDDFSESGDGSDEESEEPSEDDEEVKPKKSPAKGGKGGSAKPPAKGAKSAGAKGKATKETPAAAGAPKKVNDVEKWVLDFLNTRNRPYSSINVVDSSGGAIKKAAAEKALTALHEAGQITCKDLKKQKIYMAKQELFEVPDANKIAEMQEKIKELTDLVATLEKENKSKASVLQQLQSQMSDEQLDADINVKSKAIAEMQAKLEALRSGTKLIDETEKARIQNQYETYRMAWRKRKRMTKDIIDAVCGDMKRPKDLMEELGIDTDEQMQVTLEDTELSYKKTKS